MKSLQVNGVSVSAAEGVLVEPVSLAIAPGRPLTLLGETGSGKSLLAQAIMGILPRELQAHGVVIIHGETYQLPQDVPRLRRLWGRTLASLPQEPWLSLDPTMPIQQQIAEGYRFVRGQSPVVSEHAAGQDLQQLGLQHAARRFP
ncbi:ATP-binding cassette domain-containing protein, partial [Pantoea wallisii]|uniref:ATP-binding cassette domain-containing protein n=1 Tax=Pantoea wallisii TaxID=1076551 RepID=UPI000FFB8ABD